MNELRTVEINGKTYSISYQYSSNKSARASLRLGCITIKIPKRWPIHEQKRAAETLEKRLIKRLLKPETRLNPTPMMNYEEKSACISKQLPLVTTRIHDFNTRFFNSPLGQIRIKQNLSNWGSCSRKNNISINLTLLFLPSDLLDYVIIHELAHTKIRNHSPSFWKLVQAIIPDYKEKKRELRKYLLTT